MAGAEARAVWQRAANRCFVQEDAKRAPKLACCQSSNSSSRPVDEGPTSGPNISDHPAVGFMAFNRNPSYASLPPDTRWWLHSQPSFGYQKGLTYEQLKSLEAEVENLIHQDDGCKTTESSPVVDCELIDDHVKESLEIGKKNPEALSSKNAEFQCGDLREISKPTNDDTTGHSKSQNQNAYGLEPELPWDGGEKNMPWWRVTDKDDLASLVAQKSLNYIQNCDLPPPQNLRAMRYPCMHPSSSYHEHVRRSSLNLKAQKALVRSPASNTVGTPSPDCRVGRQRTSLEGHLVSASDNSSSYGSGELRVVSEGDSSKAQLLEALRHSQTRAREAEKAAEQVCAEKEDLLNLFFKQASQLFAYKQWFQLLQLETLYYQIKNSEQPMSNLFPVVLPWTPQKGRKLRTNWHRSSRSKRAKRDRPKHEISKYAFAFALGLGLVGAGILLGWTVGWMLPF